MTLNSRELFHLTGDVAPPQITPDGPYSARRFMPVTGGTISGERINGVLLAGGSDCQLIRPDGVAELDVRLVILTDDGVHILMRGLERAVRRGAASRVMRFCNMWCSKAAPYGWA